MPPSRKVVKETWILSSSLIMSLPIGPCSFEPVYGCGVATHLTAHPEDMIISGQDLTDIPPMPPMFSLQQKVCIIWKYLIVLQDVRQMIRSMYWVLLKKIFGFDNDDDYVGYHFTDFTVPGNITIDCSSDPFDLSITGDVTDESDNCDTVVG